MLVLPWRNALAYFQRKTNGGEKVLQPGYQVVLSNYGDVDLTKRPRFADEDVRIDEREDELFVTDEKRDWDFFEGGVDVGRTHWLNGGGNSTDHIVTHFKADLGKAVFSRLLYGKTRTKVKKEGKVAPTRVAPKKRLDTADDEVEIIKLFFFSVTQGLFTRPISH